MGAAGHCFNENVLKLKLNFISIEICSPDTLNVIFFSFMKFIILMDIRSVSFIILLLPFFFFYLNG